MTEPWEREISKDEADDYRDQYGGIPADCVIREEDRQDNDDDEDSE